MAFNIKVSVVLLVMLVVAASADARADLSEVFVKPESAGKFPNFCTKCECIKIFGTTKCYRYERKEGGCPFICGSLCVCTKSEPPSCRCIYEVETCTPKSCSQNTIFKLENLHSLNRNY